MHSAQCTAKEAVLHTFIKIPFGWRWWSCIAFTYFRYSFSWCRQHQKPTGQMIGLFDGEWKCQLSLMWKFKLCLIFSKFIPNSKYSEYCFQLTHFILQKNLSFHWCENWRISNRNKEDEFISMENIIPYRDGSIISGRYLWVYS